MEQPHHRRLLITRHSRLQPHTGSDTSQLRLRRVLLREELAGLTGVGVRHQPVHWRQVFHLGSRVPPSRGPRVGHLEQREQTLVTYWCSLLSEEQCMEPPGDQGAEDFRRQTSVQVHHPERKDCQYKSLLCPEHDQVAWCNDQLSARS